MTAFLIVAGLLFFIEALVVLGNPFPMEDQINSKDTVCWDCVILLGSMALWALYLLVTR